VSIASRDPERARRMAGEHSISRVARDYDAVLDDQEVDAVYIPLVNHLHKEWTLRALEAGKHVLCEKPLAMDAAEAEVMAAAASAAGKSLMEAFMYRFHPRTRAFVEEHRAAQPLYVQASFGFPLADADNYRRHRSMGGGALLDVGCYVVNASRWVLGEPDAVLAQARVDGAGEVDMSVNAMLSFEGGATASTWCSFESAEEQGLKVVTREGSFALERPFTSWRDPDDPYQLMVESFADSAINGGAVAVPLEDSIANMRVIDRIREAAKI
jgi:xylose dehydrogenase (NAD/NADP)